MPATGGILEFNLVGGDEDLLHGRAVFRFVLEDDGQQAELGQGVGELSARVALLDAAGQGGLGAHGDASGVGRVGGSEDAAGENELVRGGKRVTVGRDFLIDYAGSQGASAEACEVAEVLEIEAFGPGIDAQNLHEYSLDVLAQ